MINWHLQFFSVEITPLLTMRYSFLVQCFFRHKVWIIMMMMIICTNKHLIYYDFPDDNWPTVGMFSGWEWVATLNFVSEAMITYRDLIWLSQYNNSKKIYPKWWFTNGEYRWAILQGVQWGRVKWTISEWVSERDKWFNTGIFVF